MPRWPPGTAARTSAPPAWHWAAQATKARARKARTPVRHRPSERVCCGRAAPAGKGATMTSAASPRGIRGSASRPDDHVIVLFGATGDLARRKLLPGLFHLSVAGLLPDNYRIIGSARRTLTDEQFREHARQSVTEFGISKPAGGAWGPSSGHSRSARRTASRAMSGSFSTP